MLRVSRPSSILGDPALKIRNLLLGSPLIIFLAVGCDSTPAPVTPPPGAGNAAGDSSLPQPAKKGKKELSQSTGPGGLAP